MTRNYATIACFLTLAACASAPLPTTWSRIDGRALDTAKLEADKSVCRGEMEQAQSITAARGLAPLQLPGQERPSAKVYSGCMAQRGYAPGR
jgi:hypothetical protein